MAAKKKAEAPKVHHVKYYTESQKVESQLNKLSMDFESKRHKLVKLRNELWAKEHRAADSRRRAKDLKELRAGTLRLQSEGARRLWDTWVVPEFMPQNITELRRVTARLEEFYGNIVLAGDEPP